ncbi:MAG: ShlB/FhaC/HecB family hemolysin secretion/activation protein, partial [Candidatus Phaeomarinobacter sp.]
VDSGVLLEDLNWLNQNPYRNVAAVVEPGRKAGETNLTLRSREVKPWQVYAGYQNSGVESTDRDRVFVGFNTAGIPLTDHLLSYQLTASPDFWWDEGPFGDAGHADYESHSVSYFVPLPWRHKLTVQASYIDSTATLAAPFTQESESAQVYVDYAVPIVSQGDLRYDGYGLVEWKQQNTNVRFGGIPARKSTLGIGQLGGGVRGSMRDDWGATGFDLRVVVSPGGLVGHNDDGDFVASTGNPDADATYAYLFGSAQRLTPISLIDSDLNTALRFQVGSNDLAGIEQFSAGGANTVRGYEALEVSGSQGVAFSNELRLPTLSPFDTATGVSDALVPFAFIDTAYVNDDFSNTDEVLLGTGVGADYSIDRFFSLGASLGVAVLETRTTDAGDVRGHISATIRY